MQILIKLAENIGVMVLTIAVLLGFGWLMLMILHWGLKLKSGSREEDGLADLWQEAITRKRPNAKDGRSENNRSPGASSE